MKRFGFITFAVLTAVFFSSCNDSDGDYASSWAFASAETLNSNDYYFVLDDNKTVYPSDKSRVAGYKPEDDNRDHAGRGEGTARRTNQLFRRQHEQQLAQRGNRLQRFGSLEA